MRCLGSRRIVREAVPVVSGIHECRRLTERIVNRRRAIAESVDFDRSSAETTSTRPALYPARLSVSLRPRQL